LKLGIRDYVDEPEFSDEGAKLRGMEFAAVYTTGILGKTPSWVLVIIDRFAVPRADGTRRRFVEEPALPIFKYDTFPPS